MADLDTTESRAKKGTTRYKRIRTALMLSGLSLFAQLYFFQPLLPDLGRIFSLTPAVSSLAVTMGTAGMAVGLFIFAFKADSLPRKTLMVTGMLSTSVLTLVSAVVPAFWLLVLLNFAKGIAISSISAVALAYIAEELKPAAVSIAISLYMSGNIAGGMAGRVFAGLANGWLGWRWTTVIVGIVGLLLALLFSQMLPEGQTFESNPVQVSFKLKQMASFLRDPLLLSMYGIAAIIMGVFVSVYNYVSFRLAGPPFSLPHYIIAFVFVMYITGIAGSLLTGRWADKANSSVILRLLLNAFIIGVLALLWGKLWLFVVGLGVLTFSFFGAHTTASRIVSQHAASGKSTATSLYWLFYYVGSSVIGTLTGTALSELGWSYFIIVLLGLLIFAYGLIRLTIRRNFAAFSG